MIELRLYAIRHIPTGALMPSAMFRQSARGFSWWEPTNHAGLGGVPGCVPRFFFSRGAAALALSYWLKGPHIPHRKEFSGAWDDPPESYLAGSIPSNPSPIPRNPVDMEIVVFNCTQT